MENTEDERRRLRAENNRDLRRREELKRRNRLLDNKKLGFLQKAFNIAFGFFYEFYLI